jgi:hypothetical protein
MRCRGCGWKTSLLPSGLAQSLAPLAIRATLPITIGDRSHPDKVLDQPICQRRSPESSPGIYSRLSPSARIRDDARFLLRYLSTSRHSDG